MKNTRISALGGLAAIFAALLWLLPSVVGAQDVPLTAQGNVPGEPFDDLQDQVDVLDSRATELDSRATELESRATTIESRATELESSVTTLERVEAQTFTVICTPDGGEIEAILPTLKPGDTLSVSGTCNPHLEFNHLWNDITWDGGVILGDPDCGGGRVTILGVDPTLPAVEIWARNFTLRCSKITGGVAGSRDGVLVHRGGDATIDNNIIENTGRNGISVSQNSTARILNNIIRFNPNGHGISVRNHSFAVIGASGPPDARVAEPNTIQNNGSDGIRVTNSSDARIAFNTINNNDRRGISVSRNSSARIGRRSDTEASGNTISGNGSDGILVERSSDADIAGNTITGSRNGIIVNRSSFARIFSDIGPTPNTISNNLRNGIVVSAGSNAEITDNTIEANVRDGITIDANSGLELEGNTGNNGNVGLRCETGSFATGTVDALTGTDGAVFVDVTCIENLDDFSPVP